MSGDFELTVDEIRVVARYAAESAQAALEIFERDRPDDPRPRAAIEAAWTFADGAPRSQLQRVTALDANQAAKDATTAAARAAARAAGDAAAAAYLHPLYRDTQVGHILRAAASAAHAAELAAGGDDATGDRLMEQARRRATPVLVDVLRRYPPAPRGRNRVSQLMATLDTSLRRDLPVLSDGVVRLRPFAAEDAAALAAIWTDPAIRARNSVPAASEEEALRWVADRSARAVAGEAWEWAVVDAATGRLAGRRALKEVDCEHRRAVAACWIGPGFRGRQFAARSLRLAAAHAFSQGLFRVQAECEADNLASIRSVITAGMRHEGTLRSYFVSNAGTPVDAEVFGLVPEDLANPPAFREQLG